MVSIDYLAVIAIIVIIGFISISVSIARLSNKIDDIIENGIDIEEETSQEVTIPEESVKKIAELIANELKK